MRLPALFMLGFGLWVAAMPAAHAAVSDCGRIEARLGGEVRAARAALMQVPVGEMETDVGAAAQAGIEGLKDRIVAFVTGTMRCIAPHAAPANIQRLLAARGDAFEDRRRYTADHPGRDQHGNGLAYSVERPRGHPRLLAVVARFAIECGNDSLLVLFERSSTGWRPLMIRRSARYREISGAYGGLQYALSPPDRLGRWYLATEHGTPWCTSAWSSLHYDLSRPGPAPERPNVFFRRDVGTYLGNDVQDDFRAEADLFQVRHEGGIANSGILIRRHVETYSVRGEAVRRIQPAAFIPRDFADEWVDSDWSEAAAWAAPDPAIRNAHRRLHARRGGNYVELETVRRCAGGLQQVQFGDGATAFYLFVRGRGPFRIVRASRTPMQSCGGPDLNGRNADPH